MTDPAERYLALARDGLREPTTTQQAGTELHKAALRIKVLRPTSANRVIDALEAVAASWPEALRPALAELARIAGFAVQAPDRLPASDGAAARRGRGRGAASEDDEAPPDDVFGDDGDVDPAAGEYRRLVRDWTAWVDQQGLRPDANCGWLYHGQAADTSTDQLRIEFVHRHQLRHARLRREDVVSCVEATVKDWRNDRRIEILAGILGGPSTDEGRAALRALIRAWTGGEDPLHVAILAHWIWQVKRRAAGMGVEWDLMPVLVGPQGSGKTTEVDRLCSVLAELSVPVTAVQIVDQREAPLMSKALAARWDEMSGASRADGDALKRAISQVQSAFRRLYSNDFEVRRRCVTFIGTSNFHLSVILNDTSGARRFAEIFVSQVDWEAAGKVDVRQVWNAVSEQDPAPILEQLGALREHQRHLVPTDLLRMWMEKEAATGFPRLRIFRADGEPDCIEALDAPPRKDGDQFARPGGWRRDQIAVRLAHFGRGFGRGSVQVERLEQRLLELGWVKKQVRVGPRALNQREPRWFLDQAVRQRLMSSEGGEEPAEPVQVAALQAQDGGGHGAF